MRYVRIQSKLTPTLRGMYILVQFKIDSNIDEVCMYVMKGPVQNSLFSIGKSEHGMDFTCLLKLHVLLIMATI